MHTSLRSFLSLLQKEKEITEVKAEVDPFLELPEIHRRVIDEGGPALLFTKVKGSKYPVVTNLFGTERRVELATGPRPENLVKKAVSSLDKLLPPKPRALWNERRWLLDFARSGLKRVDRSKAPVTECRETQVNLRELPALTGWQEDGGPFITLPLVYTEDPVTREHNLGMYRMQIYSENQTGMHWQIHKGGGFHHYEAEMRNVPLPVTVFLGGPPALIISAIAPLPEMLPELIFTSFLIGEKLNLVEVSGQRHPLIAEAEFAICGEVLPKVRRPEGPFGDHYGYYSLVHDFPVFNVKEIYRRKDAIYPATVVGKPRQEDYFIGEFLQRLLSPLFPVVMSGVKELWTYGETGFHSLAAAIVRDSYRREAMAHAFRILGEGQLTLTKFLMVTDVPCALSDFPELLENILQRFDPARDLLILNNTSMDTLDYTGRKFNEGSKAIMTGLGRPLRELPREYRSGPLLAIEKIKHYCGGCLLLSGSSYVEKPELAAQLVKSSQEKLAPWPLVILVDDTDKIYDQTTFLWTVFTRFDPAHDIYADAAIVNNKIEYRGPVIIDARMKPFYPDELLPREDIVKLVEERWSEYFK
ncbi:UbiD family decarboxylase [Desulfofarcimen acetoxidans DSM 771]|uniref:UbiD family decarboxylase n=1 Tax=Desulfofarcimen acetoxidans (strain ATCC 49208 / DSM 771 / KCTC 5769 / VKM B-1644 / 5575) TaxID=485916 RepID=C8W384_DESAS|nr:UbiD family decarboxylase [Desulfofarcimen acetoxidans]ACV61851.1 UbiD family decarboxylase [Desulfofarcimen acetoxidans DSM 771]